MILPTSELDPSQREQAAAFERGDAEILAVLGIAQEVLNKRRTLHELSDTRIEGSLPIISPLAVANAYPQSDQSKETVGQSRESISSIIENPTRQSKLIVVVGPCGVHDVESALEYAQWLRDMRQKYSGNLELVMRTYLEKPRTTTGWEGFIEDPGHDGSYDKNKGYLESRRLLNLITSTGLPVSTELLNTSTPQYLDDLFSWGAVGARTTESQVHRKLVSGVSFPVGFKNGTGGSVPIAVDAIITARRSHYMDGINMLNQPTRYRTRGNPDTHLILRGGKKEPNYGEEHVRAAKELLLVQGIVPAIMIDASHANSRKDHRRQLEVSADVARQIAAGDESIVGVMLESNLVEGRQDVISGQELAYGQSITDACMGLSDTEKAFDILSASVSERRSK